MVLCKLQQIVVHLSASQTLVQQKETAKENASSLKNSHGLHAKDLPCRRNNPRS